MAKPPKPELAFQDDAALMGPQQNALLDAMKRAGAKDVRVNAIYGKVRSEGYGGLDQLVNAARARGIKPQVTIMSTPGYMPQADQTLNAGTTDPRQWQSFANEVAKHFKGRVGRYSIGNEMNIGFFKPSETSALAGGRAYRGVYRGGYAGVKAADPTAQVLLGEMVGATNARDFLRGVLGGKKPIRTAGLAYHPYDQSVTDAPAKNRNAWDIDNLPDLQATLARYKRQGKLQTATGSAAPLYLTEMGYFAGGKYSDAQRAQKMARAYRLAQAAGARELVSYQMAPTQRPLVQGAPTQTPEGGLIPGAVTQAPGWVWDTSLHPELLGRAIRAATARATTQARAARKR
jgi:hypothetical protein